MRATRLGHLRPCLGQRGAPWLLVVALLAACGGPAPSATAPGVTAPPGSPAPHGPALTFMVYGDPADLQAYQDLVAAYRQLDPAAQVELIPVATQLDYERRLTADFTAGTPADVVLVNYKRFYEFESRGLLTPLAPYLAASAVLSTTDFYRLALTPYYHGRTLVCLPQSASGQVLYYNRALFDQAGLAYPTARWSWDDFLVAAQALTRDTDGDGVTDVYGFGTEVTFAGLIAYLWQRQVTVVDNVLLPRRLELNLPPGPAALQWLADLQVTHHLAPDAAAESAESSESRFINGRLGLYLNSRRGVAAYRAAAALDWDVAPIPSYKGRHTNLLTSDGYCVTSAAPDPAAAWRFIEFAASAAGQTLLARTGRVGPSLISVAESPAFLDPIQRPASAQVFVNALASAWPLPPHPNWNEIEEVMDDEMQRAFYGRATVAEVIAAAAFRTEEFFKVHVSP
ncbi:MAG: sugar ABC transporter substrate-binding protein [Anaerolineales bacterium]|nr:sugar ABC transporter substrate-binding protein [Anaerolineales bacterium]